MNLWMLDISFPILFAPISQNCENKIGNKIHCAASKVDETWWKYSLTMDYYVKVQHLGEIKLLRLGRKTQTRRQNVAEIVFRLGVSEIQCIIFKQNNVNFYEIYNICIDISIVLHSRIIFFREKENLISASNISD